MRPAGRIFFDRHICAGSHVKLTNSEERCDERVFFRQARIINTALTLLFSQLERSA
jgi:hypothetical protein